MNLRTLALWPGILAAILVGCQRSPDAGELGSGQPPTPIHAPTFPPTWTPDPGRSQSAASLSEPTDPSPAAQGTPTLDPSEGSLTPEGPWVLLTAKDGRRILKDLHSDTFRYFDAEGEPVISPAGTTVASMSFEKVVFTELPSLETLIVYEYPEGVAASGMMGVFRVWSPNGQFFAFLESAGPDVASEIMKAHIFSRADRRVDTLQTTFDIDDFLGWSPDSRFLVLRGTRPGEGDGLWAFETESGDFHQVDDSLRVAGQYAIGEVAGWSSGTTFVDWQNLRQVDGPLGGCDRVVREVDVNLGVQRTLAGPGAIMPPAYDPFSNTIFFGVVPIDCGRAIEPGLYRYDLTQDRLEPIRTWTHIIDLVPERPIHWSSPLDLFIVESAYPSVHVGFFSPAGDLRFTLDDYFGVTPSPDGKWILLHAQDGGRLLLRTGEPVNDFPAGAYGDAVWLPDSSGLILETDDGVELRTVAGGWQPTKIPGADSVEAILAPPPD